MVISFAHRGARLEAAVARIVEDGYCFIKPAIFNFRFGKLEQSRGNVGRFNSRASKICEQLPGSLCAACANLQAR